MTEGNFLEDYMAAMRQGTVMVVMKQDGSGATELKVLPDPMLDPNLIELLAESEQQ